MTVGVKISSNTGERRGREYVRFDEMLFEVEVKASFTSLCVCVDGLCGTTDSFVVHQRCAERGFVPLLPGRRLDTGLRRTSASASLMLKHITLHCGQVNSRVQRPWFEHLAGNLSHEE